MTVTMKPPAKSEDQEVLTNSEKKIGKTRQGRATFASLGAFLPNVLVIAALGSIGYVGHHTGWKIPKFSALFSAEATPDGWCEEHSVPEAICVACNPELFSKGKPPEWCKEHGVHECPLHHPEFAQLAEEPVISTADLDRARRALEIRPRPENSSACKLHLRRVQFASKEAVEKAGVDIDLVQQIPMTEFVTAYGEIGYDQTRVANLSTRAGGMVWRVDKQIGDRVMQGDVLALVDAAEVGRDKAAFLESLVRVQSRANILENMQRAGSAVAQRQIRETEATLHEAQMRLVSSRQALVNLGLPVRPEDFEGVAVDDLVKRIQFLGLSESSTGTADPEVTTANLLPLKSPISGVVVAREVVTGEVVDTTKVMFVVVDTSRMWLTLNVALEDAKYLKQGQMVRFRPDGGQAELTARISWISTAVDERTRTIKVRADLVNTTGELRDETFGTGHIVLREEPNAVVVPKEAVQWDGSCHVVFVRDKNYFSSDESPKLFHTRTVRLGAKNDEFTEIIAGVLPGEVVVTTGAGVLRAELLKNNLGAG